MQRDEPHTLPNSRQHTLDYFVSDFAVGSMSPPDKDIGVFENVGG